MQLTPVMQRYVLHWGEMGQRWGVNRSVAQIHALLYLADRPLNAEEIVELLGIARSNVSTSLKELQGWELVRMLHLPGDRRDHFEAKQDPWDMLMTVVEGRKRREIDPTLEMLRACVAEAENDKVTPTDVKAKMVAMKSFMEELTGWYEQMRDVPQPVLRKLLSLGAKITAFLAR
ncbi:GbsR/MarR family transcriptional regulator [Phenylobacterium sp.]|uniref:GbsR/MarR family transcriptional regulator n=1 Tax=Phenylobacterium sp. TaxID=1871053 RepID=UPI002F3F552C